MTVARPDESVATDVLLKLPRSVVQYRVLPCIGLPLMSRKVAVRRTSSPGFAENDDGFIVISAGRVRLIIFTVDWALLGDAPPPPEKWTLITAVLG